MDIWDHDDEANVLEAVKKLNEVKGLKGKPLLFALFSAPVPGHSCAHCSKLARRGKVLLTNDSSKYTLLKEISVLDTCICVLL